MATNPGIDKAKYSEEGFLHLPSVLDGSALAAIHEGISEILRQEKEAKAGQPHFEKANRYRRFTLGLHYRNPAVGAYIRHPVFAALGRALLGDDVDLYFSSTLTKSEGRNAGVDWHQDIIYDPKRHEERFLCWTSITASFPENGGLSVIPGSHRNGILPHEPSHSYENDLMVSGAGTEAAVPMRLAAGDILVLHPLLVHGSPENASGGDRMALMAGFQKPCPYTEAELKIRIEILKNGIHLPPSTKPE